MKQGKDPGRADADADADADAENAPRLPANPHDALFRVLMEDPRRAATLLREYLPEDIREALSDEPPRLLDGTYIDEQLRATQSDRLFEVELKTGRPAFVYALIEHKSHPDPGTPLQLLGYMVRIWKRYATGDDASARLRALPPIVPLVFYHGASPWNVPVSIFDTIEDDERLRPLVRSMRYILRDLGQIETGRLSGDPTVRAVLTVLKYVERDREVHAELLDEIALDLREESSPDGTGLMAAVFQYVVACYEIEPESLARAMRLARPRDGEAMMGTMAERWLQEGRQEGMRKGEANTLVRLLERRFCAVPDSVRERVATASLEQIDIWFDAAIDAESLDEVFGDTGNSPEKPA